MYESDYLEKPRSYSIYFPFAALFLTKTAPFKFIKCARFVVGIFFGSGRWHFWQNLVMITMTIIRNIATLSIRIVRSDEDKLWLVKDVIKYKIDISTLSETRLGHEECTYQTRSEKKSYILYSCTEKDIHQQGVDFLIQNELEPDFKRISKRIATSVIQVKKGK